MSQRYRGVPPYLRDEITEVKKEIASGKSPEEIQAERELKRGKGPMPPLKKDEMPGDKDKEAEGKEGKKGGKVVKIKCPKCDKIQTVTTPKRPLEFACDGCGMKLVLKK
jgi:ribosomal protein S27E